MSPSFNETSYVSKVNNNGIYQSASQHLNNKNTFSETPYKSNKSKSKRTDQDSRETPVFTVDPKKVNCYLFNFVIFIDRNGSKNDPDD